LINKNIDKDKSKMSVKNKWIELQLFKRLLIKIKLKLIWK